MTPRRIDRLAAFGGQPTFPTPLHVGRPNLVDPERTPSGYRKFYAADLTRLRWILFQQKEHFLPLKVIKERLDELGPGELAVLESRDAHGGDATATDDTLVSPAEVPVATSAAAPGAYRNSSS